MSEMEIRGNELRTGSPAGWGTGQEDIPSSASTAKAGRKKKLIMGMVGGAAVLALAAGLAAGLGSKREAEASTSAHKYQGYDIDTKDDKNDEEEDECEEEGSADWAYYSSKSSTNSTSAKSSKSSSAYLAFSSLWHILFFHISHRLYVPACAN